MVRPFLVTQANKQGYRSEGEIPEDGSIPQVTEERNAQAGEEEKERERERERDGIAENMKER